MNESRFLEEDFNEFLHGLISSGVFDDKTEEGITKLVIDQGYGYLSTSQKYVFKSAISHYITEECSRCGEDIPWTEMLGAEDNGGMCGWCQQLTSHDD